MTTAAESVESPTLSEYVKASARDAEYVASCHDSATALVDRLIGSVPMDTARLRALRWQAILVTGANLWGRRRRLTESSAAMTDGMVTTTPDRPTRDPLDAARHILGDLLGPGIA